MTDENRPKIDLSFLQVPAELDQALSGIKNIAIMAHAYRESLMQAGFTRDEALGIIRAWIVQLTANASNKK